MAEEQRLLPRPPRASLLRDGLFQCSYCARRFRTRKSLGAHLAEDHASAPAHVALDLDDPRTWLPTDDDDAPAAPGEHTCDSPASDDCAEIVDAIVVEATAPPEAVPAHRVPAHAQRALQQARRKKQQQPPTTPAAIATATFRPAKVGKPQRPKTLATQTTPGVIVQVHEFPGIRANALCPECTKLLALMLAHERRLMAMQCASARHVIVVPLDTDIDPSTAMCSRCAVDLGKLMYHHEAVLALKCRRNGHDKRVVSTHPD